MCQHQNLCIYILFAERKLIFNKRYSFAILKKLNYVSYKRS